MKKILLAGASAILFTSPSFAAEGDLPNREEMWQMIQTQQKQIEALTGKLNKNEDALAKTEAKVEQTKVTTERIAEQTEEHSKTIASGLAKLEPANGDYSNSLSGWWNRTSIGGYAELIANKGSSVDEIDARRFVLFVGHEFTDDIRAFAEIEVEHADEIFLEQAYLEFDIGDYNYARVGGLILPIGILNEKHEPTTFFGSERNPVETAIIPTTLRETGVWFGGNTERGFSYDLVFHSGLDITQDTPPSFLPRSGRAQLSQQDFEDFAGTARIKYTGIPGVELASSINYQEDLGQGQLTSEADAILYSAHADIRRGPWGLRALGALWDIDGTEAAALGRDEQYGFYIEPSYRFRLPWKIGEAGIFARFNQFDNSAGNSDDTDIQQYDFGVNFWPHENVVLKTDVSVIRAGSASGEIDEEVFNFAAGWVF